VVRTTLGAEVETTVTVSGSESVDYINRDQSTTLPSGGSETIIVRPPTGFVYELLDLSIFIRDVAPASSGTHEFIVSSEAERIDFLKSDGDHTKDLGYRINGLIGGVSVNEPDNTTAQLIAPQGKRADETRGFLIKTFNRTDADQTDTRQYRLWVRQIQVADT